MSIISIFVNHSFLNGGVPYMDYQDLENKPSINGVVLESDMDLSDIGLVEMTPAMVSEIVLETFGIIL
jgi:hypothetical protein